MTNKEGFAEESRYRYDPIEPPPEGWRRLRSEFNDDGFFDLYTDLSHGRMRAGGITPGHFKWVELRQIVQRRFVSEWSDAPIPTKTGSQ